MKPLEGGEPTRFPEFLFVYGTLGPRNSDDVQRYGFVADCVRGHLYDLGPYPALIDHLDPSAPWVEGHVRPVTEVELRTILDPFEGVHEGLFKRVISQTKQGLWVWLYLFSRPLPGQARGPLLGWNGTRIDPTVCSRPELPENEFP